MKKKWIYAVGALSATALALSVAPAANAGGSSWDSLRSFGIQKVDAETGVPLAGAEFQVDVTYSPSWFERSRDGLSLLYQHDRVQWGDLNVGHSVPVTTDAGFTRVDDSLGVVTGERSAGFPDFSDTVSLLSTSVDDYVTDGYFVSPEGAAASAADVNVVLERWVAQSQRNADAGVTTSVTENAEEYTVTYHVVTGEDGYAYLPPIQSFDPAGVAGLEITVTELKAPEGYVLDSEPVTRFSPNSPQDTEATWSMTPDGGLPGAGVVFTLDDDTFGGENALTNVLEDVDPVEPDPVEPDPDPVDPDPVDPDPVDPDPVDPVTPVAPADPASGEAPRGATSLAATGGDLNGSLALLALGGVGALAGAAVLTAKRIRRRA